MDNNDKRTIDGEVYNAPVEPLTKDNAPSEPLITGKKGMRKFSQMFIYGGIAICALASAAAVVMYFADRETDKMAEVTSTTIPTTDPAIEIIKHLGNVNLSGLFGSAKVDFTFDATTGRGERYYTLQSDEVYTLILKTAVQIDDRSYKVEIKELLKGRIDIGTYTGILTENSFVGTYTSSHGVTRDVSLTAK